MLPTRARLTSPSDFAKATKSGSRVATQNFVGYLFIQPATTDAAKAGLIIGKSVGGSVQRHRLSRQVRHLIAPLLPNFPEGSLLVIRALNNQSENLSEEISYLTSSLLKKVASRKAGV